MLYNLDNIQDLFLGYHGCKISLQRDGSMENPFLIAAVVFPT